MVCYNAVEKGCDDIGFAEFERKREEKIDVVIYNMSPRPNFLHGIIDGNIYKAIGNGLKNNLRFVFMENLDFHYHPDKNDDYVCPDIMIACDRKYLKGSFYNGVPKFIVDTLSPSTAKRRKKIYMNRREWKNIVTLGEIFAGI